MADELRMSFSVTAVEQVDVGNSQTHDVIDSVAQKTFGGTMTRIYNADSDGTENSGKIALWENAVVSLQDAGTDFTDGLDAHGWTEASAVTRGDIPSLAKVLAVEYVSSIGTANNYVYIYWGEEGSGSEKHCFAKLSPGEGIVIPLEETVAYNAAITGAADSVSTGGVDPAKLHITVEDYDNGTNEATINVLLAGR
tara:strand:- start:2465 stop:3052 length:588 start_codon:yes stop_codon:yes gene_type:complete